jgi:hypothetical protein
MRIPHFIPTATLMMACIVGCSKSPSRPVTHSSPTVTDLGEVDFTDHTPKCFSLGENKSFTMTAQPDSHGIALVVVLQTTNADKTVKVQEPQKFWIAAGRSFRMNSGDASVRLLPTFKSQ